MSMLESPIFRQELRSHVLARTGSRLRNLDIQLSADGVRLHGQTATFYVKQLAQHSVREMLPDVLLHNDITVNN